MGQVLTIALHDLKMTVSDRGAVVWLLLMPVVFATFFGLVFQQEGEGPRVGTARLTVVDHDHGPVAAAFLAELESERLELVELSAAEAEQAEGKIRTLVIPAGFSDSVLGGEQVRVRLELEPKSSPEASLVARARIVAAIAGLIGKLVASSAEQVNGEVLSMERLVEVESPVDLVTVESRFAGRARIEPGGFAQSIPGNAVMFVMLVALTYGAASLASERTTGLLRRLATAPLARWQLTMGKIVGRFAIAAAQVTVLVGFGAAASAVFDLGIEGSAFQLWVVLLIYAAAVAPLGVLFGGFFRDPDRAANVGVVATITMAALGGCWWPLEIVPRPFQIIALALPTGWAMRALHGVVSYGQSLAEAAQPLLVLVGFGIVFTVLATRLLRVE